MRVFIDMEFAQQQLRALEKSAETREAAWLYIAASHFTTLCAFGVFALLYAINGSWDFATLKETGTPMAIVLAALAFFGFGTKAGIMPMHIWLPTAHAQAPSHVSAVMSGVMIKKLPNTRITITLISSWSPGTGQSGPAGPAIRMETMPIRCLPA